MMSDRIKVRALRQSMSAHIIDPASQRFLWEKEEKCIIAIFIHADARITNIANRLE